MHSPKTISDGNNFYDFGLRQNEPYPLIWHNGGTSGIKSVIQIIPEAKLGCRSDQYVRYITSRHWENSLLIFILVTPQKTGVQKA